MRILLTMIFFKGVNNAEANDIKNNDFINGIIILRKKMKQDNDFSKYDNDAEDVDE